MTSHHSGSHEVPSTDPGIEAENFVASILLDWKQSKKPFLDGRRITRIIHSDKNDKCDREGVDVWVMMSLGQLCFPIQVKSSHSSQLRERHYKAHPDVRYLIVAHLIDGAMDFDERLKFEKELEDLINNAIRSTYPRRYREILKRLPPKSKSRRKNKRKRN